MTDRKKSSIPFVGLHAHSVVGSPFDALGYPQEHMDFAYENGSDALALTDHGNANGMSYQVLHARKMKEQGKDFKPIFGVEAYFLPSIDKWKEAYEKAKEDKKEARKLKNSDNMAIENEGDSKAKANIIKKKNHLILIAQNQIGLNNIFSLISKSYEGENRYRYPRLDYKLLEEHNEGIIASSACLGGVYAGNYWDNRDDGADAVLAAMRETTENMQSIFGDRWYGELQWFSAPEQHELNNYIIDVSKEYNMELISTADSHYPTPTAWKDRELYKRLGFLGRAQKPEWMTDELPMDVEDLGMELFPKNGDQMWEDYKKYSSLCGVEYDDDLVMKSITNTHKIAFERIESFMPDSTVRLPEFVVPPDHTATGALTKLAITGLKSMDLHKKMNYIDRLKEEIKIIDERGFSKYFLTMKAIADRANDVMLSGPGRGSAAGSLLSYVLGITQIDPIKYDLLFSRFMRRDATDYPDIDYDVSDRMKLTNLLIDEWGANTVVPISNYNTLQLRSLIKDVSKFYNVPFTEVNPVTSKMIEEATPAAKKKHGIKSGVYTPTFEETMEFSTTLQKYLEKYPFIKTHIEAIYGSVRSISRHAGGVVIGEQLDKYMPLITNKGVTQTPWSEGQNVRHLEPLGFIKFDFLGLSTLRMIEVAIEHILERYHGIEDVTYNDVKEYYDKNLHPDVIDLNDKNVYENIFHKGNFAGVFQFTQEGAQEFCMRAKPKNIIDISAITSIYRPGPLGANVDKSYVEAKGNPDNIHYIHPLLREVTQETYGFLIFQEQIALLAHKLGKNVSLDEGNALRKLLTKKGTGKDASEKDKIQKKFVEGCIEKNIDKVSAEKLWANFEYFSGYGFNKSHAVSYSVLSYQCAWLLNYYPSEWVAAFLDREPEGRKEQAINIVKKMGYEVRPIDINLSTTKWSIEEDNKSLRQPFNSIKGLGEAAIKQIMDNRPFNTAEELLFNEGISYSKLNKKVIDVLCRCGALDNLIDERFTGDKHFWGAVACERPKNKKKFLNNIEAFAEQGSFSDEEKIRHISDLTGVFPFDIVVNKDVQRKLQEYCVPPLGEWDEDLGVAWFIPREIVRKKTKNGKDYWVVRALDPTSTITSIKCWGIKKDEELHINRPYMAKLDYDDQWGFSTRSIRHNFKLLG